MLKIFFTYLLILYSFNDGVEADEQVYVTQTVYGFLDFTTTIGNTVMVFSPKSSAAPIPESTPIPQPPPIPIVKTVTTQSLNKIDSIQPTKTINKDMNNSKQKISSMVQVIESSPVINEEPAAKVLSSKVEIVTSVVNSKSQKEAKDTNLKDDDEVVQIGNNLGEPEYNFLSRQPSEFVEETYKITNLSPNSRIPASPQKSRSSPKRAHASSRDSLPTGLVTKLGGTVVKDGITTVHETSVIGTFISGKYAQVLQSSSHIYKQHKPGKITPSSTLRILKTAAPSNRHHNEPVQLESAVHSEPQSRLSQKRTSLNTNPSFKNRFKKPPSRDEEESEKHESHPTQRTTPTPSTSKKTTQRSRNKPKNKRNKNRTTSAQKISSSSVSSSTEGYSRRAFKPKIQPSVVESTSSEQTSLYKFKLNRAPGRWQYKTSPKPRVNIRKQNNANQDEASSANGNTELLTNDIPTGNAGNLRNSDVDLEQSGSVNVNGGVVNNLDLNNEKPDKRLLVETLNVEISTPADFKDTYYEIATIKTPYSFQVGTVKNTRYITVTSTFEKTLDPEPTATSVLTEPLTENILASSIHPDQSLLESSVVTLSPLYLQSEGETPPLETTIETFSTTQNVLKTHILPVIHETNTTSLTLIQTYHITRFVTATKTLPPLEAYQFIPSKRLKEFNSKLDEAGSELHLELEFGDEDENDDDRPTSIRAVLPEKDHIEEIGSDFDLIDFKQAEHPQKRKLITKRPKEPTVSHNPQNVQDQLQQLALLRLINPAAAAQLPQFITTSKPVIKLETVYESHVIPIINGQSTSFSTISRPVGTVSKTEFEYGTSTFAPLPLPQIPQIPQVNPFQQQQFQQQQFQITTAPVITQTVVTQTQSKVLKLTFGAKTAYTTLYSTNVVPTMLTTFVTTNLVQPTAAGFPGYYPSPFAPYPFVG